MQFFGYAQKKQKDQGQPEWLRPFVRPTPHEQYAFYRLAINHIAYFRKSPEWKAAQLFEVSQFNRSVKPKWKIPRDKISLFK